jgi:adenylylsulfate kinase-like enzyme
MDALRRRAQSQGYETYVLDADEVLDGLETILAADIVEDVIEGVADQG